MKVKDFDAIPSSRSRPRNGRRPQRSGLGPGTALLGIVVVIGVFGLLALLYNLG